MCCWHTFLFFIVIKCTFKCNWIGDDTRLMANKQRAEGVLCNSTSTSAASDIFLAFVQSFIVIHINGNRISHDYFIDSHRLMLLCSDFKCEMRNCFNAISLTLFIIFYFLGNSSSLLLLHVYHILPPHMNTQSNETSIIFFTSNDFTWIHTLMHTSKQASTSYRLRFVKRECVNIAQI